MGDVVFQQGSLKIGEGIKLFTEHDMTRPIGKLSRYEEDNEKIVGVFKIARTNAGDDALAEAQEGLRTGFSVGAMIDDYVTKGELVIVNAATLREVSHVTFPAFGEYAQITEVAASADISQPTESEETIVSNEVTPEVVEEVAAEVAAPAVEAQERNMRPAIFTAPRSPINSKASYLEHNIRAALGNEDSPESYEFLAGYSVDGGEELNIMFNVMAHSFVAEQDNDDDDDEPTNSIEYWLKK